jgi:CheY-like chemotaxis protein
MLRAQGLELSVSVPGEPTRVDGDATRLTQVVGNLLQNAAKFSGEGGSVKLALTAGAGWAEIVVSDTGAGIDPELLTRVFEPFVQAERTLARSQGGLGLGLALVKGLTEMHGGTVRAASPGLGKGATFTVRLPTTERAKEADRAVPPAAPRSERLSRVLVVEDNRDLAESLGQLVEMLGHQVEIVHDGAAAIAKAHSNPPDVLLCDIGLPGMSGYDVARAFRADPELQRTHLVAVSGYVQPEDMKEAADAGFERHVKKPADLGEIERLLGS